jgi:hypothetical protein
MTQIVLQPTGGDGSDTRIDANTATSKTYNYGTSIVLIVGKKTGFPAYIGRVLIAFDLSSIPAGATITSATLALYCSEGTALQTVGVFRGLTQWYEGTKLSQVPGATDGSTWNQRNGNTDGAIEWGSGGSNPGGVSGVDFAASATDSQSPTVSDWTNWTVTADVAAWMGGTSNYGWWLINADEVNASYLSFRSSDYTADSSQCPKLTIDYGIGPGPHYIRRLMQGGMIGMG